MKTVHFKILAGVVALTLGQTLDSSAIVTNFFANFQSANGGSISSAAVLDSGTGVGTWSFLGLPDAQTGAGAISSNAVNRAAVFANSTNAAIPGMPLPLATNYFVDSASYPNTYPYDAGSGTRVIANFATPGQFTGADETRVSFKWGTFGTANSGQAKGQFVRGLDASDNEVFKLLYVSGSGSGSRIMYVRTSSENTITLNANNAGIPAGTAVTSGASGTTYNSVVVNADPSEYIQVSAVLANGQITFTFVHSLFTGSPVTTASFPVNSAATTISKLEFSAMWNASQNGGNKGFWLDDLIVSDGPLPNPKTYQWVGNVNDLWNIAATANWRDLGTGLSSAYTEGTVGGTTAMFDDTALTNTVSIVPTVSPNNIVFNNNLDYALTGGGKISGSGTTVNFNGTGTVTMSNLNDYVGISTLNAGRVRLANDAGLGSGQINFAGGWLSSVGPAARTLGNSTAFAGSATLGDLADNGPITFTSQINAGNAARILTNHSDVTFAAGAIGTGNNGRISAKYGAGKLTMKGMVDFNGSFDIFEGVLVLDGASFTNSDRLRLDAIGSTTMARVIVTNGASVVLNGSANNLVVGGNSIDPGTNIFDLAGSYSTPNANASNGELRLETATSLYTELNLLPGGDYAARSVEAIGGGSNPTRFNFNGGTLRARGNNQTFFQGLTETFIRAGGAKIDDGGFAITIAQDLLDGGGAGGFTKLGAGTVTLNSANNTFTGPTVVSNGTLNVRLPASSGAVTLEAGAALGVTVGSSSSAIWNPGTVTLRGGNALVFTLDAGSTAPSGALLTAPTVNSSGLVTVGVTGLGWPIGTTTLLDYSSGGPAFVFNPLPAGIGGYLTNNTAMTALQLVVTTSASMLGWYGYSATDANGYGYWDIGTSLNWNSGASTYMEYGSFGDVVTFDANTGANLNVNITTTVRPAAVTVVTTSGSDFNFFGGGKVSGQAALTKRGAGALILNQSHDYSGGTLLQEGSITLGVANALPVSGTVLLGAPAMSADLVLNGFNQTIAGLVAGGSGSGARRVFNGSATPVTLTFDTPAGAVNLYTHTTGNDSITDGDNFSIVKNGLGEQRLATCTYWGTTTINAGRMLFTGDATAVTNTITAHSGGTLGGNGRLGGAVILNAGSALSPGNIVNGINTLTISNTLTMNGNVTCLFDVSKDTLTGDQVAGVSGLTYSGTLIVTNTGAASFTGGETFQLFSASGTKSGSFGTVTILPNTGATGSFNPATGILTISAVPTTPTNLTFDVSGNTLTLSWPANYRGWKLQAQTNAAGLGTNWVTVPGTENVVITNFPVVSANPAVFYRLIYQAP